MAFTEAQVKSLNAKLDSKHVKTRQAQDNVLTYVEGWHVIAEANRIFGYDAWDRRTVSTNCVWSGMNNRQSAAAYTAKVRISVRAGPVTITREGCGSGEAKAQTPGEAHELALKAAETDATKRALATFGNPFGLALYDRDLSRVRNRKALDRNGQAEEQHAPWVLRSETGQPKRSFDTGEAFLQTLKQAMSEAPNIELLFALWEHNVETVRALNRQHKGFRAPRSLDPQALVAHLKACAVALASPKAAPREESGLPVKMPNSTASPGTPSTKIDKSVLTISEPKRIRSKEHLRFVAKQPCVICGRAPSHAHHVRFAQPRGLGLKVSDEFTVPLCAIHHTENHAMGNERGWWKARKIDPLPIARTLWQKSCGEGGAQCS